MDKKQVFKDQKYFEGDILRVECYDQGDEEWQEGIVQILTVEKSPPGSVGISRATYKLKTLSGTFTAIGYNADYFEDPNHILVEYLCNIYDDAAAKILYGSPEIKKGQ